MNTRRISALLALLFVFGQQLHAQVKVEMSIKRNIFIVYEPIIATVSITNLSGHDLTLNDADGQKWFSFQVLTDGDRIVPPLDLNYRLNPLTVPAGQTVKHSLNLTSLYGVQEFGAYRVKASVYSSETQRYYSSAQSQFQITEGKLVWQQTVGVPPGTEGAGSSRIISLLTFRGPKDNTLYIRVEDKEAGIIYITSPIGKVLLSFEPDVMLDKNNQIHVLQLVGAKTYTYSRIGLNGEWLGQMSYNAVASRPVLKKNASGDVTIAGGQADVAAAGPAPNAPKLSDRPPGLPKP